MDKLKHLCDGLAACSAAAVVLRFTLMQDLATYIPIVLGCIASLMSIVWYAIRFYEWYTKGKKTNGD